MPGMRTTEPKRKEDVKDPIGISGWPKEKGRDGECAPMQWDSSTSAGFSTNPKTWLRVAPDYKKVNVEMESKNPDSMLNWYKRLIALRRGNPALHAGDFNMLETGNSEVLAWKRSAVSGETVVVACSFSAKPETVSLENQLGGGKSGNVLASSGGGEGTLNLQKVALDPYGSVVVEVQ